MLAGPGTAEWRWKAPGTSTIYRADYAPATFNLLGCLNEGIRKTDGSWQTTLNGHPGDTPRESYHPTACGAGVLVPPIASAQVILGNPGRQRFCSNATSPCDLSGSPIGNSAVFGIQRLGLAQPWFAAYLPGAQLRLTDYDRPYFTGATNSLTTWVRTGTGQVVPTATDTGLGIKKIRMNSLNLNGSSDPQTQTHPCAGDRNDRCPATWNTEHPSYVPTFTYDVDSLPEGVDHFGLKATDIVENDSLPDGNDDQTTIPPTKVDRSPPTNIAASGQLFDLRDQYINGQGTKTVTATAHDPASADGQRLSGIKRLELEDIGHGTIASVDVACDTTADICPVDASENLSIDTSQLAEGAHQFRIVATDLGGNVSQSDAWTVLVDRSPPAAAANFRLSFFDAADPGASTSITWDAQADPDLPDETPGSGVDHTEARSSINGGPFSAWEISDDGGAAVYGGQNGNTVTIEVRTSDAVGNASTTGSGSVTLGTQLEDPGLQEQAAAYYTSQYGGTAAQATAWLGVQDQANRISAGDLDSQVSDAAPNGFGGVWFDNAAKRMVVGLTNGTPSGPVQQVIQSRGLATNTDIVRVTYTQRQLEVAQAPVEQEIQDLIDAGLVAISRDVEQNRIEIEVAVPATAEQRNRIQAAADSAPVAVAVTPSNQASFLGTADACGRNACDAPLRGGVIIGPDDRDDGIGPPLCTSGFITRDRQNGQPRIMTAGHCIRGVSGTWATFSAREYSVRPLGPGISPSIVGSAGDAGAIAIDDNSQLRNALSPIVYVRASTTGSTTRNTSYDIRGVARSHKGDIICVQGYRTGSHCITVDKTNQPFAVQGLPTIGHLGIGKGCGTMGGDSGAPIVKAHQAYGTLTGHNAPACRTFYQGAAGSENLLGVNISLRR